MNVELFFGVGLGFRSRMGLNTCWVCTAVVRGVGRQLNTAKAKFATPNIRTPNLKPQHHTL